MVKKLTKILFIGIILSIFSVGINAKRFTSQYCEFELPNGWKCSLEGSEWVCQSLNKNRKKESIIILAAKIRGGSDSISNYQRYLKGTKTFRLPGGKIQVSEAKYTKIKKINSHQWIDSMHLASEVPGFYTRYLATVKEDLGVAVTFSVSKDNYHSYQGVFDKVVSSLRVFRQKRSAGRVALAGGGTKDDDIIPDAGIIADNRKMDIGSSQKRGGGAGGSGSSDYLIYLLIAGAVIFFIIKKKKGKGSKKKKGSKKSKK